jgi:hypothetical protein
MKCIRCIITKGRVAVLIKEYRFVIMIDIKKIGDGQSCDELIAMATKGKKNRVFTTLCCQSTCQRFLFRRRRALVGAASR